MNLKVRAVTLSHALRKIAFVAPRPLTAAPSASYYLVHCFRREGRPLARVCSRGMDTVAQAGFALEELDGEGQFLLPVDLTRTLLNVPDDVMTIDVSAAAAGSASVPILIRSSSGMRCDLSTGDPRLIAQCDDFDGTAEEPALTYHVAVMRTALQLAERFLPVEDDVVCEPRFHSIRIFDSVSENPNRSSGDGHLFCSDSARTFDFWSEDFEGKGLAIHARHGGPLVDFLSTCSTPTFEARRGGRMTYATSGEDDLFGWAHQTETHPRFAFYSLSRDKYVLRVPRAKLLSALDCLSTHHDGARFIYTHHNAETGGGSTVHFVATNDKETVTTFPVEVVHTPEQPNLEENIEFFVEVRFLESLFADATQDDVVLRIALVPKSEHVQQVVALLRTFEDITVAADGRNFPCKVVRFMASTIRST